MDKLPKDVIVYIALNMDLPEILSLCRTSKRTNKYVCDNDMFWLNKTKMDYPGYPLKNVNNYKDLYKKIKDGEGLIDITITLDYQDPITKSSTIRYVSDDVDLKKIPLDNRKYVLLGILEDFISGEILVGVYNITTRNIMRKYHSCSPKKFHYMDFEPLDIACLDKMTNLTNYVELYVASIYSLNYTTEVYKQHLKNIIQKTLARFD